jgi:hypothetical protein
LSELDNSLRSQKIKSSFHSSSHHERQYKHGKLKSLLREILD